MRTILLAVGILSGPSALHAQQVSTLAEVLGRGDMTVAPNGDLYVADFGSTSVGTTITRVTADGDAEIFVDGLAGSAAGIDIDSQGNIIVANFTGGEVNRIAPDGTVSVLTQITGVVGVVVTDNDEIVVAGCNQQAVLKLPTGGGFEVFSTGPDFACPNGITVGHDDAFYVVNFLNNRVVRIDADGTDTLFATTPGNGNGHIAYADGRYYLTGRTTNSIYAIDTAGEVSLLAGTGDAGNLDGIAAQSTFSSPNGIAISVDGREVYVGSATATSASANTAIRRITLDGPTPSIDVNPGIAGAWYNAQTPGQGMFFDTIRRDDQLDLFVAWFTFELVADKAFKGAFSSTTQRWFTAQGPLADGVASLSVSQTTGGVFDDPTSATTTAVGEMTIRFESCTEAEVEYSFSEGPVGAFPLTRLTPDQLCTVLADQGQLRVD